MDQQNASPDEKKKRQWLFTRPAEEVCIGLIGCGNLPGLPHKQMDNKERKTVMAARTEFAEDRGLNAHAYRSDAPDTGLLFLQREPEVRLGQLMTHMEANGFVFVDGFWHEDRKDRERKVYKLFFSRRPGAVAKELPEAFRKVLHEARFRNLNTVWLNPKPDEGTGEIYRSDTIEVFGAEATTKPGRQLVPAGNAGHTYALVADKAAEE